MAKVIVHSDNAEQISKRAFELLATYTGAVQRWRKEYGSENKWRMLRLEERIVEFLKNPLVSPTDKPEDVNNQ